MPEMQDETDMPEPTDAITVTACPPPGVEQPPALRAALADLARAAAAGHANQDEPLDALIDRCATPVPPADLIIRTERRRANTERDRAELAETAMNDLYRERAHLVAVLATGIPAVLVPAGADPAWPDYALLYLDSWAGQISWHIHQDDLDLFANVRVVARDDPGAQWDGHDKEQALDRLRILAEQRPVNTIDPAERGGDRG